MFRLGGQSDYCGKPIAVARCNARMALGPLRSVQTTVAREWARGAVAGLGRMRSAVVVVSLLSH